MPYFLLIGFVYCFGFGLLIFYVSRRNQNSGFRFAGVGFFILGIGLAAELFLGNKFDENALRVFYLCRIMLPAAWLGHPFISRNWSSKPNGRWLGYGLLAASFIGTVLLLNTSITLAQNWFDPKQPVFTQYSDILATNRPTRALAILLSCYGALGLMITPVLAIWKQGLGMEWQGWIFIGILILGTLGLFLPFWDRISVTVGSYYLIECLTPVASFMGIRYFMYRQFA